MAGAAGIVAGAALTGAASAGFAAAGIVTTTLSPLAFGAVSAALSAGLSGLQTLFTPKPKFSAGTFAPFEVARRDQSTMIRQPITTRRGLYGEAIVSGPLVFYETTDDNRYHHLVIPLAMHEVEAISTIYFAVDPIFDEDLDADGNVVKGKFAGKARIKKHLGGPGQLADPDLVAEVAKWTTSHVGNGIAYIYVRTETDRDLFPSVIPRNIRAWVKGRRLYDPRDASTRWQPNPALCLRDYMTDTTYGRGVDAANELDDGFIVAAANICDEFVATKSTTHQATSADPAADTLSLDGDRLAFQTGDRVQLTTTGTLPGGLAAATDYYVIRVNEVSADHAPVKIALASSYANALAGTRIDITSAGSGTHTVTRTAEPRYTCNGVFDTARMPKDIIDDLLSSMAGRRFLGDKWRFIAGAWTAPTIELDEGDLRGPIKRIGRHSRRERFNAVKGVYVSPLNDGQPTDYPPVTNSTFETRDGGERIYTDLDLPFTTRPQTAQRIAKIMLMRHRNETTVKATWSLAAFRVQPGDTVMVTNARRGWTQRPFEVVTSRLGVDGRGDDLRLVVKTLLRATASTDYDFDAATEETTVTPAPTQSPLDATSVGVPQNVVAASGSSELFLKSDGTVVSRIKVSWTPASDRFVDDYEVQVKKSSDSTWQPAGRTAGEAATWIWDVEDGVSYDVRVRSINQLGVRSVWVTVAGHVVVGKSAAPADVTGFVAQQNGNLVSYKWNGVPDLDLGGYELRYMAAPFDWASAKTITRVTRGTFVTNDAVPPGDWVIGIKAVDTSGNESQNAATVSLTVKNANNVVASRTEHPRWVGTLTGLVRHDVSGKLLLDDQNAAAGDDFVVFDTFNQNPVAEGIYEAPEIDLGFDADGVRVYAEMAAALGPGVTSGSANPILEIDYRDAAAAYDGFEEWPSAASADFRYLKTRIRLRSAEGIAYLSAFKPIADVPERTESAKGVTISAGGTTITFAQRFHTVPSVQVTADASASRVAIKSNVTESGFTAKVFDAGGTDVGGTIDWQATGA